MTRINSLIPAVVLTLVLAAPFPSLPAAAGDNVLSPEQKKAVERIISDYIRENPGIIGDAIWAILEEQKLPKQERTRRNLKRMAEELNGDPGSYVGGNPEGDISLIEFFDYNCSYCKRSHKEIMEMVAADGNIRFVFKEFPILGSLSVYAAKAALAARKQGKYEEFNLALMTSRGRNTNGRVLTLAKKIGLDVERLKRDMEDPEIADILRRTKKLARALDIEATPTYVIGELLIPGYVAAPHLKELINDARETNNQETKKKKKP